MAIAGRRGHLGQLTGEGVDRLAGSPGAMRASREASSTAGSGVSPPNIT